MIHTSNVDPGTAGLSRKRCFDPVIDQRTRLLVLGSLPGERSLAQQEYYANRQNKFWQLMSEVIGKDLPAQAYPARLQTLLLHGVGLWDVVAEAHRVGSLDSQIRGRDDNDLRGLLARFPSVQTIAFNGGTASKLGLKVLAHEAERYQIITLPSSSPAYTKSYAEKLASWAVLRHALADLDNDGPPAA